VLSSFRPDAVLGYWAHPDGAVALRIGRALGVPVGQIVGGSDILLLTRNASRRRQVLEVLEGVDAIFAVGPDLKAKVIGLGVPQGKVHLFNQGIDRDRFTPGNARAARIRLGIRGAEPVLLWVGHMVRVKGLEVLLAACARLQEQGIAFRLYLVGDGPLRGWVQRSLTRTGLQHIVHLAGSVLPDDLADWYRAADLTVLSSHSEGLPNVLRESLACGTPFVATRVGSVHTLALDSERDLVPAGDSAALAEAIRRHLDQPVPRPVPFDSESWEDTASGVVAILQAARERRGP
jgi:glycosyltransferase involved in cell wall biosynthesis